MGEDLFSWCISHDLYISIIFPRSLISLTQMSLNQTACFIIVSDRSIIPNFTNIMDLLLSIPYIIIIKPQLYLTRESYRGVLVINELHIMLRIPSDIYIYIYI